MSTCEAKAPTAPREDAPTAVLPAGNLKRLHVNQHNLRANRTKGSNLPPITIKHTHGNTKAHHAEIQGPSVLVHSPGKPLACGAVMWVETRSAVLAYTDQAHDL